MVRKLIRTGAACVAVLLLASAWGDTTIFGQGTVASVTINKFSYPATDDVQISGSGFTSGETVSLTITQIGGGLSVPLGTAPAVGGSFSGVSWNPDDSTRGTFLLTATGLTSAKVARAVFTVGLQTVADDAGSDDLGGQKDLSFLTIDYGVPGSTRIVTTWGWDDTAWTGGNTGDACTLFDVNSDGDADYSLCVTVAGSPAAYQATRMYRCGPAPTFLGARSDRCSQPTLVTTPLQSSGSLTTPSHNSDPFGAAAAHGQGNSCGSKTGAFPCVTDDTVAALVVQLSDINNQSAKLINICSYPSQEPNSNPSDCVVTPNSGFLTIRKESSPTAGSFTFNTSSPAIGGLSAFNITTADDNGVIKGDRQFLTFTPATLAYVREAVPAGWTLSSAGCVIQTAGGTTTGSYDAQNKGVSNVEIREGLETICTFVDTRDNPSLTLTKFVDDTYSGAAPASMWTLTATKKGTTDATTFTSGVAAQVPPGTYVLSESGGPTSGYLNGASWNCGANGTSVTEVTVDPGATVSCSITNTVILPTLVVRKTVNNDAGGNKHAVDFSVKLNNGTDTPFIQDTAFPGNADRGTVSFQNLAPGTYTVTENPSTGYTADVSNCANIVLQRGETKTCTIVNTATAASPSLSTVQRLVVHDSVTITGVRRGATQKTGNNIVTFKLYTTNSCDGPNGTTPALYTEPAIALDLTDPAKVNFTVPTVNGYLYNPGAGTKTGTFFWRVTYSGDDHNLPFTTPCGSEKTVVTLDPN